MLETIMKIFKVYIALLLNFFVLNISHSDTLKIGIMQDMPNIAGYYRPLINFFKTKKINIKLVGYAHYNDAAIKFQNGDVDLMFAGSGVAGCMIIKKLAYPLLRPVHVNSLSTYSTVILAPKDSPKFHEDWSYFTGKKITCCSLASSGEFFVRSYIKEIGELKIAASHDDAIRSLSRGFSDIAIVKNTVWNSQKSNYPNVEIVGKDSDKYPNKTLIVSFSTNNELIKKVNLYLLDIENDNCYEANEVRSSLKILKFIPTTIDDFFDTLELLKKAGVTKDFEFKF